MIVSSDQDPEKVMALTFQQWKPVQRPPTGIHSYPRITSSQISIKKGGYRGLTARNITFPNPYPTKPNLNPIPSSNLAITLDLVLIHTLVLTLALTVDLSLTLTLTLTIACWHTTLCSILFWIDQSCVIEDYHADIFA